MGALFGLREQGMNREVELIKSLTQGLPRRQDTILGVGDDCAIVKAGPEQEWLLKTDAMAEGVHFLRDDPAVMVGRKAISRLLSDVAAMGGEPGSVLVTIGVPKDLDPAWLDGFYEGLRDVAKHHELAIVGGETIQTPGPFFCSLAMTGHVQPGKAILRSGARVRDAIFVTGDLGGSIAGKHLNFEPRIRESRWLVKQFEIHAMIDLSDGLAGDLRHLCEASEVGAELWTSFIPISRSAKQRAQSGESPLPALAAALSDGEDFELLFTVDPSEAVRLKDAWKEAFPETPLSCIGRIMEQPRLMLRDDQGLRPLTLDGYDHFNAS
jgi:thiamine-monophosphate kinase